MGIEHSLRTGAHPRVPQYCECPPVLQMAHPPRQRVVGNTAPTLCAPSVQLRSEHSSVTDVSLRCYCCGTRRRTCTCAGGRHCGPCLRLRRQGRPVATTAEQREVHSTQSADTRDCYCRLDTHPTPRRPPPTPPSRRGPAESRPGAPRTALPTANTQRVDTSVGRSRPWRGHHLVRQHVQGTCLLSSPPPGCPCNRRGNRWLARVCVCVWRGGRRWGQRRQR